MREHATRTQNSPRADLTALYPYRRQGSKGFLFFFSLFYFAFISFYFQKVITHMSLSSLLRLVGKKQTNHKIPAKARNHQRINWLTGSNCSWLLNQRREIRRGDVRTSSTVNRHVSACFSSLPPLAAWIWMAEVLVCLISTDEPNQPRRQRLSESQLRLID